LRVNDFRAAYQNAQMRVVDASNGGSIRTIVTKGTPHRIDLNPGPFDVLALFARRGLEHVRLSGPIALFLLCLATARRRLDDTLGTFAAFASGFLVALGASVITGSSASLLAALQAGAGALLVVAALQNITGSRTTWIRVVAVAFGVLEGLILGAAFESDRALAGTHALAAFLAYAAPLVAAALLIVILARLIVDAVCQTRLQERWAVLLLSAIPIHSGLHGILGVMGS
jgi:HupE/UreJ protein